MKACDIEIVDEVYYESLASYPRYSRASEELCDTVADDRLAEDQAILDMTIPASASAVRPARKRLRNRRTAARPGLRIAVVTRASRSRKTNPRARERHDDGEPAAPWLDAPGSANQASITIGNGAIPCTPPKSRSGSIAPRNLFLSAFDTLSRSASRATSG